MIEMLSEGFQSEAESEQRKLTIDRKILGGFALTGLAVLGIGFLDPTVSANTIMFSTFLVAGGSVLPTLVSEARKQRIFELIGEEAVLWPQTRKRKNTEKPKRRESVLTEFKGRKFVLGDDGELVEEGAPYAQEICISSSSEK